VCTRMCVCVCVRGACLCVCSSPRQRASAVPQVEALITQMADMRIQNARLADASSSLSQDRQHFEVGKDVPARLHTDSLRAGVGWGVAGVGWGGAEGSSQGVHVSRFEPVLCAVCYVGSCFVLRPQRALRLQGDVDALRSELVSVREERDLALRNLEGEQQEKERRHLQVVSLCFGASMPCRLPGCLLLAMGNSRVVDSVVCVVAAHACLLPRCAICPAAPPPTSGNASPEPRARRYSCAA
jgi:hypothetical protein